MRRLYVHIAGIIERNQRATKATGLLVEVVRQQGDVIRLIAGEMGWGEALVLPLTNEQKDAAKDKIDELTGLLYEIGGRSDRRSHHRLDLDGVQETQELLKREN